MILSGRLILLVCCICLGVCQLNDKARKDSFVGYNEQQKSDCVDKRNECENWAKSAECVRNPSYMRPECQKSCPISQCQNGAKSEWDGYATQYRTRFFSSRLPAANMLAPKHFKVDVSMGEYTEPGHRLRGMPWLTLSSIGVGTYLGNQDQETDEHVTSAIIKAVSSGINVIDTASNYRNGRAEKSVGDALYSLLNDDSKYGFTREMLFISTKAGFIADDLSKQLIKDGEIQKEDLVGGMNCIHPKCIRSSLERSLSAMRIKTVDLLYLHNAAEMQLPEIRKHAFMKKLKTAFLTLEELRKENKIRAYGLATWTCFRVPPQSNQHLSLQTVVDLAKEVGGVNHGFRYIQVPINIGMPEAWKERWQIMANQTYSNLLWVAAQNNVGVFTSGPLGEGSLIKDQTIESKLSGFSQLRNVQGYGAKLLQLARSTPGIVSTLVGMKDGQHVTQNLQLTRINPLDVDDMTLIVSEYFGQQ
eukprot:TRINITY_DN3499_c0_g1_i1.p1 TRINITY_DN3499_c0_g1~~TRINITY_DN3499_c0_g1_i1.p1  ORF type:complete len:474 (+),score=28.71 TRINITY_DN3499_c0_g1_i1:84-1505(+)